MKNIDLLLENKWIDKEKIKNDSGLSSTICYCCGTEVVKFNKSFTTLQMMLTPDKFWFCKKKKCQKMKILMEMRNEENNPVLHWLRGHGKDIVVLNQVIQILESYRSDRDVR